MTGERMGRRPYSNNFQLPILLFFSSIFEGRHLAAMCIWGVGVRSFLFLSKKKSWVRPHSVGFRFLTNENEKKSIYLLWVVRGAVFAAHAPYSPAKDAKRRSIVPYFFKASGWESPCCVVLENFHWKFWSSIYPRGGGGGVISIHNRWQMVRKKSRSDRWILKIYGRKTNTRCDFLKLTRFLLYAGKLHACFGHGQCRTVYVAKVNFRFLHDGSVSRETALLACDLFFFSWEKGRRSVGRT